MFDARRSRVPGAIVSPTEVLSMRSHATIHDVADGRRVRGALLSVCTAPECTTLTMGGTCVTHDSPVTVVFPRGRPFRSGRVESAQFVDVGSIVQAPVI